MAFDLTKSHFFNHELISGITVVVESLVTTCICMFMCMCMCMCMCMRMYVCACVCIQAKYECARSHSALKVVSPDWILDSIEANKRLEEEVYHPSHLKPKETEYQMSAGTCNGAESAEGGVTVQTLSSQTKPNDIVATPLQGEGVAIETSLPVIEAAVPQRPALQSADSAAKNGEGARGGEATPTGVRSEQLLDGVVIYFTDYQDCVEDHTLDKWKLVSE